MCVTELIEGLVSDYTQNVPIIYCKSLANLFRHDPRIQLQRDIYDALFGSGRVWSTYPPNICYKRAFVKRVIQWIECGVHRGRSEEVLEELLSEYIGLDNSQPSDFTYKTFMIPTEGTLLWESSDFVVCKEHCSIISGGTTGQRTWPGSLRLAEYILANSVLVAGKSVVEIGSGVGFLLNFLSLAKIGVQEAVGTDFNSQVLKLLNFNVALNGRISVGATSTSPKIFSLSWGRAHNVSWQRLLNCDIAVGADVVYDPDLVDIIVETIEFLLLDSASKIKAVVLSLTIRDEKTFLKFKNRVAHTLTMEVLKTADIPIVFYHDEPVQQNLIVQIKGT